MSQSASQANCSITTGTFTCFLQSVELVTVFEFLSLANTQVHAENTSETFVSASVFFREFQRQKHVCPELSSRRSGSELIITYIDRGSLGVGEIIQTFQASVQNEI